MNSLRSKFVSCLYLLIRFGGYLIQQEIIQTGDMLAVFFAVIIGAFSLGQAAPNVESILTAAGAAGQVFETIDRVSLILIEGLMILLVVGSGYYYLCSIVHRHRPLTLVLMKVSSLINSRQLLSSKMSVFHILLVPTHKLCMV